MKWLNALSNLTFKRYIKVENYFQLQSSTLDTERPRQLLMVQVRSEGPNKTDFIDIKLKEILWLPVLYSSLEYKSLGELQRDVQLHTICVAKGLNTVSTDILLGLDFLLSTISVLHFTLKNYMLMIFALNYIYELTVFHLYYPYSLCSHCYGNSRNSCSSCIDRWRRWQYPCCVVAAGLVAGWVSIAPCRAHSHPRPPPLSLCLRNLWAWPHRIQAANHASPLVS